MALRDDVCHYKGSGGTLRDAAPGAAAFKAPLLAQLLLAHRCWRKQLRAQVAHADLLPRRHVLRCPHHLQAVRVCKRMRIAARTAVG